MSEAKDARDRTLTIERILDAPIELVWEAWTKAEHIAKWWCPKGMNLKIVKHDFRVGGAWHYVMLMPDGNEFISEGVYSEIVPPSKIVTSANFRPMTEGIEMIVLLEKEGGKTKFTFSCVHPTEEYCKQQEKMGFYNGWGSAFTRLSDHLNEVK